MSLSTCVNVWKLTTACDTRTTLRNCYRLKGIVRLRPNPPDLCLICRDAMIAIEMVDSTYCCVKKMHTMCLRRHSDCIHCGEKWVGFQCCVCNKAISGGSTFPWLWNPTMSRMPCCDADVHNSCIPQVCGNTCPCCSQPLDNSGHPQPAASLEQFIIQRRNTRRVQRA